MKKNAYKNIKTFIETSKGQTLLAALCTVLCFACTYLIFGMRYQLNDDAIISNIAAGAYGGKTHYLVYVNVLIGWLLKAFYAVYGGINWFVLILLLAGFVCFTCLGRLALQKWGACTGSVVFIGFLIFYGVDFFAKFHYVRYSGLLLVTGFLYCIKNLGRFNAGTVGGMVLVAAGSMLRFQQFASIGGLAAPLLLYFFWQQKDKKNRLRSVISVGALVAVCFAFLAVDTLAYRQDEGWAKYKEYNSARTQLSDFKIERENTEDILLQQGYSVTDFEMLYTWNFYDADIFPLETLQQINASIPNNGLFSSFKNTIITGLQMLYTTPAGLMLWVFILCWFLLSSKKRWPAFAGVLAILGLEVFYLQWRGRLPDTILSTLTLAAIVFCAACYHKKEKAAHSHTSFRWSIALCALLMVSSIPYFSSFKTSADDYWASKPPQSAAFNVLSVDKDTLYLADVLMVDAANGYDVWHARPRDYFSNIVFTGSWLMHSPYQEASLQSYGLQNVYADSLNRPDVVYVDLVYRELKEDFLQQHYNSGATLEMIQEDPFFRLYTAKLPDELPEAENN